MRVITTEKLPIKMWWDNDDYGEGWTDVLKQFQNIANHPLAQKWVCGMSDFHHGYGMPIGGVLATKGGVIPYAVGLDIGCGMLAYETNIEAKKFNMEQLHDLRKLIHGVVPVGFNHHKEEQEMPKRLMDLLPDMEISIVSQQWQSASHQLGTMGGGNHFLELQIDPETGKMWIMLHSGSRNVGLRVCNLYHKVAVKYMQDFHTQLPDMELAFLPENVDEYKEYLAEMTWCMAFAEESRALMMRRTIRVISDYSGKFNITKEVDTHHNFASMENWHGTNVLIHRKGAVQSKGLVTIPGSMGTASFICEGLNNPESFGSCSHGAGRVRGRKAGNRAYEGRHEEAVKLMEHVAFDVQEGDYDELPTEYKDVDAVILAQSDLVRPVHRLEPLAVVKDTTGPQKRRRRRGVQA